MSTKQNEYQIHSLEELKEFATLLSSKIKHGGILALSGNLGAGKTTFTKYIANDLGVTDPVTSPTFTIMNEYRIENGKVVYHLDLYRLQQPQELKNLGFQEVFDSKENIVIIEWPEIARDLLPLDTIFLKFIIHPDDSRTILEE